MPEPEIPRLDAARRERLAALGIELLALRSELASAGPAAAASAQTSARTPGARLQLTGIAWPSAEPLPRAVIAALGLQPDEVSAEPHVGRPLLCFGAGTDAANSVSVPALAELRDPARKRALWPALRRLRRRLAEEADA